MRKKLVAIDFDGVLYSFASGWQGSTKLPDPPVEGAIDWLCKLICTMRYEVAIFSCRNESWWARRAIKKWLTKHGVSKLEMSLLSFPVHKPAGLLIDDRCVCFNGVDFPTRFEIDNFTPWHGKGVWDDE